LPLTDVTVRSAKPGEKPVKLSDGEGMFLYIVPTGGKMWRLKYRVDGKEKLLSLGQYPEVTLKQVIPRSDPEASPCTPRRCAPTAG